LKLRKRSFERAARRRIRAELRESQQLRKEHRRFRKMRWQNLRTRPWMGRLFVAGFILVLQPRSIEQMVALIVLWEFGSIFVRASLLNGQLHFCPALSIFNYLPMSDGDIFKVQWRTFLRGSLWSALDFSILFCVLASKAGGGIRSLVTGIALGTVEWFFIVALAVCLVVLGLRKFYYYLALLFMVSAFGLLFFLPNKQAVSEWIAPLAYWLPPVGWLVHAMGISSNRGAAHDLLPAVLSAIVLVIFPIAYNRLRNRHSLNERTLALASRASSVTRAGSLEYPEAAPQFTQPAKEVAAGISSGALQTSLDWKRLGLIERFISRVLSQRERTITDFMLAGNPQWSVGLRGSAIFLLLLFAGSWLFAPLAGSISQIVMLFWVVFLLGAFAGQWRGFTAPRGGGLQSPFYALYPIGVWELLRLVLKINLLRFLLYLPLVVVAGFLLVGNLIPGSTLTVLTLVKFVLIGLFSQPILVIAQISPGTNDGQKPMVVLAAFGLLIVLVPTAITLIASTTPWVVLVASAVLAAASSGTLLVYGKFFNNNRFDLVPGRLQSGSAH